MSDAPIRSNMPRTEEQIHLRRVFTRRVYLITSVFVFACLIQWLMIVSIPDLRPDEIRSGIISFTGLIMALFSMTVFICWPLVRYRVPINWILISVVAEGLVLGLLDSLLVDPPGFFAVVAINAVVMMLIIVASSQTEYDITEQVVCLGIFAFFSYMGFALLLLIHLILNVRIMVIFYCSLIVSLVLVDVKAVEMQLEDYASQCLKDISDYFLLLHGFLQNEERRIVDDFNGRCATPQKKIRDTFSELCESQNVLNRMRSELEFYQHKLPCDIHLRQVIHGYNKQLEQLHCQVQISKLDANPFTFEVQRDMRKDFVKYYRYDYTDPNISLRIGPMYGDLNRSFHDTKSQLSMDVDSTNNHKQLINEKNQRRKQALCHNRRAIGVANSTSDSDGAPKPQNSLARISHVKSPEHFYIQMESSLREIRELSHKFVNFVHQDLVPKTITEGRCYMAYHGDDKLWYRAMVKKILPKDTYKVFLVDLGMKLDVAKNKLYELDSKSLSIPYAALRCAIHDIMPAAGKAWTEEANNLLIEITRNQPVRVSIIEQIKDNILKVDLFTTHTTEPISVRDSFLYTGLARERSGLSSLQPQSKKMSPVARINQRLHKYSFQSGDILMVKVTHIENPQLFYVIKMDQIESKQKLRNELNFKYDQTESQPQPIFLASLQMCCAVQINNVWHRGCVEDIRQDGKVCVRLVDEGSQELVDWRQICILSADFKQQKEFAIKCALAEVEPLQANNYAWTKEAIREFRQIVANPTLQMVIFSARQNEYKVTLHVCKKHLDINIGAVLAKNGHCLSTGEASQITEVFKSPKRRLNMTAATGCSPPSYESVVDSGKHAVGPVATATSVGNKNAKAEVKVLKRTPIKVVHIVDPGEFYIQIANLVPGITKFHNQIQEAQRLLNNTASSDTLSSQEQREWFVGDHCLVRTAFENSISLSGTANKAAVRCQLVLEQCDWYRAIIISHAPERNADQPYAVFLRDVGVTVSDIGRIQLSAIDPQWDRVTNAVHRCHLACVEPTGGVVEWSHSAIDCFKHTVSSFQVLSATLHNKRTPGSNSLPIVLWGTITETADPLAPCISKYSNVNRVLVKAGLAHSVQRLDITEQLDKLVELELADGEITLEQWYKNFSSNAALKEIERKLQQPLNNDNNQDMSVGVADGASLPHLPFEFDDELLLNEDDKKPTIYTDSAPTAWLHSKGIEKSIFAGIPTYVDFDCVIYLHDAADGDLLERMRAKILNVYNFEPTPAMLAVEYKPGQACIVRYHVDKNFYRGIVQKRDTEGHYTVQFVDYGNVESVEPANLRPFAPFPKLPSIACKYRIANIRPKHGAKVYPTLALDYIHGTIVDKLVSVRVPTPELSKAVKMCSIRVATNDLAELLIREDHAERVPIVPSKSAATGEANRRQNAILSYNRFQPITEFDFEHCLPIDEVMEVDVTKEFQFKHSAKKCTQIEDTSDLENSNADSDMDDDVDDDDDEAVNACLDQLLHNLDKQDVNLDSDSSDEAAVAPLQDHHQQTFVPPRKKRMFDSHEYKQMHAQMQYETLYGSEHFMKNEQEDMMGEGAGAGTEANAMGGAFGIVDDDDDGDIVELEQSFARNYWHAIDDVDEEEKKDTDVPLKRPISVPQRQDLESSGFDKFHPNETSSVFSHFSGIETFKQPQLPAGVRSFSCSVVSIVTPTMLQILPLLTEFEYRDLELQRRIKHLVRSAPALTQFEPRTVCLSCYSKDKKWYRALIRSYNPAAKQVDVLYVDYWNTESVAIKNLRQCPMELIGWPLRTFKVCLHGLTPNPRMREKDLCQALQNVVLKRTLVARVMKEPSRVATNVIDTIDSGSHEAGIADATLMEVDLCDSNESAVPVYESLVQDNFYSRI